MRVIRAARAKEGGDFATRVSTFCWGRLQPQSGPAGGVVARRGYAQAITYGVRPRETSGLEDQLGLVLSPKSKIEDGSREGTLITLATAVADFWFPYSVELQLILRFALFRRGRSSVQRSSDRHVADVSHGCHRALPSKVN